MALRSFLMGIGSAAKAIWRDHVGLWPLPSALSRQQLCNCHHAIALARRAKLLRPRAIALSSQQLCKCPLHIALGFVR